MRDPEVESERPLELLEREITELAAHIHAATCSWLALIAEFDRREGWASWGCKSCGHWLAHTCALSPAAAREHARVARRLEELPGIRSAFGRGELSYSQVRALSRVATPELEDRLLELARHATAAQLERVLRGYRGVLARELGADDPGIDHRYVTCEHDDEGALVIQARLPAEEGELVLSALAAARDTLREGAAERPPSNADALVLIADHAVRAGSFAGAGDGYQVVVHVEASALAGHGPETPGACRLEEGYALHPETARRLACDGSVVRVLERDGHPLSVGRKTRSVPPALRRALRARDGTCGFPGCGQRRFLHAHHVVHWARGGRTDLANLVELCRHHHRLVHEGGYGVGHDATGALRFWRPDGQPITAAPIRPDGRADRVRASAGALGTTIGPDTCASAWDGSALDLPLAVDALVDRNDSVPDAAAPPGPPGQADPAAFPVNRFAEAGDSMIALTSTVPQCTIGMRAAQPSAV